MGANFGRIKGKGMKEKTTGWNIAGGGGFVLVQGN